MKLGDVHLWDVHLWVCAFRADSPLHGRVRPLLVEALEAREPFLFCPSAASSFLRLVTNPRIFLEPSDWREAHPAAVFAEFDAVTFGIFKHLCLVAGAQGNEVPDALFAALALRHNATLMTADAGMKKWPGVDVAVLESMQR